MGYVGKRPAKQIIYAGIKMLEYRGYDSVGIVLVENGIQTAKAVGDTSNLELDGLSETATMGVGHTRWATHGKPSIPNAHPHSYGDVTLVHNGIIENFEELMQSIDATKLKSETDSEVLAGVIDGYYQQHGDLLKATKQALSNVKGTFGLVILSPQSPRELIVARRGSPIVIGVDDQQNYVASDPSAIVAHTDKVLYLKDDQIARLSDDNVDVYDLKLRQQEVSLEKMDDLNKPAILGDYGSYLEKEIFEQPESIRNLLRGRVSADGSIILGGPNLSKSDMTAIKHLLIIGCGTAYYAGYYAKYKLEELLGIQVSVEHASEFRYRHGAYDPESTLAIFMSQSGETADTLASVQEAKRRRIRTMGIINSVGSTIAREVDCGGIYLHAGTEVSVASTKAYSSMVGALLMFGGYLAYNRGANATLVRELGKELATLPQEIESVLQLKPQIDKIALKLKSFHDIYYLGRNELYPVALEGALKVMEIAYVHAQAYPAGEMKHGPIALVSDNHLSILLLPEDQLLYEKGLSTLQEIKAREGAVLTISTRPKEKGSDFHIQLAHSGAYTDGLLYNVCLQLLAHAIAVTNQVNIDKPRNLAKSVTVE
jgi:glucosamine--fructose-6-phosphate aminotransferase (isomerizing)